MKKYIPLWIKCPLALMGSQLGRLPLPIVWGNAKNSFTQYRPCSAAAKDRANLKAQITVCRYLRKKYGDCMAQLAKAPVQGEPVENAPIWVFWWQGEQSAPYLIQTCIKNLRKNAGTHPVHVIHRENYKNYVQIPGYMEERLSRKEISLAHFSDYLRMKLLLEYGGLWADATVFVKKPLEEAVFRAPVWTVRNPGKDPANISGWEWSINLLGGWKGNGLFRLMVDVLERYWAEHEMVATYFMTDCLIRIICDEQEEIRAMIQAIPPSNGHYYYLQENFPLPLDPQGYEAELRSDTWLYKITWKCQYQEKLPDGRETCYARWKREFGA